MALLNPIDPSFVLPDVFARWFAARGWAPRAHQLELLKRAQDGKSVLLIAPTGGGKTLAGFLPTLVELSEAREAGAQKKIVSAGRSVQRSQGLHTLYISPLKALAVDIARNLETPVAEMGLPIRIETRTGDTPVSKRTRQRRDPPDILMTTPESLALLLSYSDAGRFFGGLRRVVLDEIHALADNKRGALLSLGLARLRSVSLGVQVAISAALLVATGLLVRGMDFARELDFGFRVDGVSAVAVTLPPNVYSAEAETAFFDTVVARLDTTEPVAMSYLLPLGERHEFTGAACAQRDYVRTHMVTPSFFDVLRIPTVEGRAVIAVQGESVPSSGPGTPRAR